MHSDKPTEHFFVDHIVNSSLERFLKALPDLSLKLMLNDILEHEYGKYLAKVIEQEIHISSQEDILQQYEIDHSDSLVLVIENEAQKFKLEELNRELQEADLAKGEFLANMSHEIRTPMNGIIGFTDLLMDTPLSNEQRDFLKMIRKSGNTLVTLVNDILDFSKIEAGDMSFEKIDFDPELLAYDVCDLTAAKVGRKSIEVLCQIGDNVPAFVKGDPFRFKQVLMNLMGNAPKFTESGEIVLFMDAEEETENEIKIVTSIRDTGVGIPEDKFESIFRPFKQADSSITRKYGGTGLGLAICKQISQRMNGDVWVDSHTNEGSIFYFSAWLEKSQKKSNKRYSAVSLTHKKALIIDDNETSLNILKRILEAAQIKVVAITSGKDIQKILLNTLNMGQPFDFCISDLHMPDISGYDIAKNIRTSKDVLKNIPLIALSSLMTREAQKCRDAGFNGYLAKPIRKEKLFRVLEMIIGGKEDDPNGPIANDTIVTQYSAVEEMKHSIRVLLAEDNPVNQKLAKMMLTKAGYSVDVVTNGQEVVKTFMKTPGDYDIILMDIQMPELDGIEAAKKLRKNGFGKIPIIAMTAHATKGYRKKCLSSGMNDYISKPIKREAIFNILEKYVFNQKENIAKARK